MSSELKSIPEYGIIYRIESGELPNREEVNGLVSEVSGYIENMVEDNLRLLIKKRDKDDFLYRNTLDFFRKRERYRYTKELLKLLLEFLEKIPEPGIDDNAATQFQKFRELVVYQTELMTESDVVDAMVKEFEELNIINKMNLWYYKGKMRSAYNEITGIVNEAVTPTRKNYHKLFEALRRISSFWFSVRREDEKRVRISDLYIFKLIRILQHRFPLEGEKSNI